jgi:hypothetical protein
MDYAVSYLLLPSYTFQDMCLLTAVEGRLGSFDEWPSEILETLFIENPHHA